ncbi:hypothetical protein BG454_16695 [Roseinatronobacter bogoriensis subsp. barguzinensis]|uniref:Uncharacterized protein n=1 Tax=Roseinatronobacter bogoriensis subsp. barguzinensis TaxID=441209 RepID=A0A2K8KHJ9_9RHOB|nr:hypothetical protein BG454_16695 [Rhodobaca barguzinensis]
MRVFRADMRPQVDQTAIPPDFPRLGWRSGRLPVWASVIANGRGTAPQRCQPARFQIINADPDGSPVGLGRVVRLLPRFVVSDALKTSYRFVA